MEILVLTRFYSRREIACKVKANFETYLERVILHTYEKTFGGKHFVVCFWKLYLCDNSATENWNCKNKITTVNVSSLYLLSFFFGLHPNSTRNPKLFFLVLIHFVCIFWHDKNISFPNHCSKHTTMCMI